MASRECEGQKQNANGLNGPCNGDYDERAKSPAWLLVVLVMMVICQPQETVGGEAASPHDRANQAPPEPRLQSVLERGKLVDLTFHLLNGRFWACWWWQ